MRGKGLAVLALVALMLPVTVVGVPQGLPLDAVVDERLLSRLQHDPSLFTDALVVVRGEAEERDVPDLQAKGLQVLRVFPEFGVLYVAGPGEAVLRAAGLERVVRVTGNEALTWHLETAATAARARDVWDAKSTSTNPVMVGGQRLTGAGVGIAIIDSGLDGLHPDLAPAVVSNKKWVCSTPGLIATASETCYGNYVTGNALNSPLLAALRPFTTGGDPVTGCSDLFWLQSPVIDATSGHGTHVGGIAAGRGLASDGRFTGIAPGAKLFGFGTGEGINILFPLEAFNWVLCNHNTDGNNIKVVNNSWGIDGAAFNANDPVNRAQSALVAQGLVITWSAGNSGGDGSEDNVNTYAKHPAPGVLGVASYNDEGRARRDGSLSGFSSRGQSSDSNKTHWPDISAPGDLITSAMASTGPLIALGVSGTYMPYYAFASGTSMSAPLVAGAVALLFQANPALTPAQVEDVVEDTAFQFSTTGGYVPDASNPTNGINYGAGHGLLDIVKALEDPRVLGTAGLGSPQAQTSSNPHVYFPNVDAQLVAGAPPLLQLQWTMVEQQTVTLSERTLQSGNGTVYPLTAGMGARFRIEGPNGVTNLNSATQADGANGVRFNANYAFPGLGNYRVEPQVNFPGIGYRAIDSFVVHVV